MPVQGAVGEASGASRTDREELMVSDNFMWPAQSSFHRSGCGVLAEPSSPGLQCTLCC